MHDGNDEGRNRGRFLARVSGGNGVDELVVVASGGDCDCEIREAT